MNPLVVTSPRVTSYANGDPFYQSRVSNARITWGSSENSLSNSTSMSMDLGLSWPFYNSCYSSGLSDHLISWLRPVYHSIVDSQDTNAAKNKTTRSLFIL